MLPKQLWGGPEWESAELGEITPNDCYSAVAARLGVAPGVIQEIANQAFASDPDQALADYVVALRGKGVRTAALTNNIASGATLIERPELVRLFDVVISSADVRLQKPDPAMYRHAETRLGVTGPEIVFLDDVPVLVEAARAQGWHAIQFRSTDQALVDLAKQFASLG